ncbi:MAG: hypothetical protein KGM91_04400 [Burkholderiales bacterium]|nr:hypothetical protein [Burkholderiales bacterium]
MPGHEPVPSSSASAGQALAPRSEPELACGNCGRAMQRLALEGHYAQSVDLDLCSDCHLVWFDLVESARLAGTGLLALIERMAAAQRLAHVALRPDAACPRCRGALKTVHNLTRWGPSLQLECLARHGAYQSFAQFMQEKGLLRPMSRLDRARLIERDRRIDCVNCGGAVGTHDERCSWCGSVASLLDVARLAHALDPLGTLDLLAPQPVQALRARQEAMGCAACGAALPPGQTVACPQCGATLAISRLAEAVAQVEALGPALRQQALAPSPELVKRRLAALDADLPRQREWVREMEAETSRNASRDWEPDEDGFSWSDWFERQDRLTRGVVIALVIGFLWLLLHR